ncbi:uncharacterized protein LOC125054720 isoform X3 [Pieris napi]|uniref:uncharacterized protein LOC125054720 isoform X3 n=1 Tax=Pieris napi TaxID=78633 RepID=UPI001FB9A06F|nr:uncharacterized protein LOC125054720 isoform X3 [Pieris napi]
MSSCRRNDSESSEVDSCHGNDTGSKGIKKNPRERFRVGVCLLRIYSENDPRAHCYVSVDPYRRVRWLEQRLRDLLALTESFVLRSRGHLLPSAERLTILCPDDPVEVFPINTDVTKNVKPGNNSYVACEAHKSSIDAIDGGKSENGAGFEYSSLQHDGRKSKNGAGLEYSSLQHDGGKSENGAGLEYSSLQHTRAQPEEKRESIQENENETDLESYKERALAILDNTLSQRTQSDEQDNIWIMEDYSNANNQRTKRKRVRRRRKNNCSSESNGNAWENTSTSGRAPRLVRALPNGLTI